MKPAQTRIVRSPLTLTLVAAAVLLGAPVVPATQGAGVETPGAAVTAGQPAGTLFRNTAPIVVPASGTAGVGAPYPSTIAVAGVPTPGRGFGVSVALYRVSHTFPSDVAVVVAGPAGQRVVLSGRCGGSTPLVSVNLVFSDGAAATLPGIGAISSGSYRPTNCFLGGTSLAAPAPPAPYSTTFSVFNGQNPNGTWSLWAQDLIGGDVGRIDGGWAIVFGAFDAR